MSGAVAAEDIVRLRAALEADPGEGRNWVAYVAILLDAGDDPVAAAAVLWQGRGRGLAGEVVDRLQERVADTLFQRAIASHRAWRAERADRSLLDWAALCYEWVVRLWPDNVRAVINLAHARRDMGRYDDAADLLEQVVALVPDLAEAYFHLASVRRDQGRPDQAADLLERALVLDPADYRAHGNLGGIRSQLGDHAAALACYRRAFELRPDDPLVLLSYGQSLCRQGETAEGLPLLRQALALDPDSPEILESLPDVLVEAGEIDAARHVWGRIIRRHPAVVDRVDGMENITALIPVGRSGSLFVHSLIDGHPEVSTLPGVYLKGWFGRDVWGRFSPSSGDSDWRQTLVRRILDEFEPMFDARSRRNVVGRPFDNSAWLASDMGFVEMGPDRTTPFVVDRDAFAAAMLDLLAPLSDVGRKDCFKLMHAAFDRATGRGGPKEALFYHIHNPNVGELAGFLGDCPRSRLLYVVRQPVQSIESWLMLDVVSPDSPADNAARLGSWAEMVNTIVTVFQKMHPHFHPGIPEAGIRLEDLKAEPRRVLPRLAAWMGVADHSALYESAFCGLKYWGTLSVSGPVDGFSDKNLRQSRGRVFGERDILILETLLWPFSRRYGYTSWGPDEFRARLADIRPWLDQPLEFETVNHAGLRHPAPPLDGVPAYRRLHAFLQAHWTLLDRDGDCRGIPEPLPLE